jgi:3',5'-cyclic AMP phosphodiesterase CpdA
MKRRSFLQLPLVGAVAATTGSPEPRPVRLGIITDPQYADKDPGGTRHYRASLGKLARAVDRLNTAELDAVVTLGDFIDVELSSFAPVLQRYAALTTPHLKVVGNHDFSVADEHKGRVLGTLGMDRSYSSHVFGGWRVVLLDGTEVSLFRPEHAKQARAWQKRLAAEGRRHAKHYNGGLSDAQLAWLESELGAATTAGQRVILACHYPVLPEDPHNLWNDREVVALIDRFPCVAAWFNGHHHSGNYAHRGHCHYVNFKGMVETAKRSAYAIATLHPDRIEIDGFDTEPDRNLKSPST